MERWWRSLWLKLWHRRGVLILSRDRPSLLLFLPGESKLLAFPDTPYSKKSVTAYKVLDVNDSLQYRASLEQQVFLRYHLILFIQNQHCPSTVNYWWWCHKPLASPTLCSLGPIDDLFLPLLSLKPTQRWIQQSQFIIDKGDWGMWLSVWGQVGLLTFHLWILTPSHWHGGTTMGLILGLQLATVNIRHREAKTMHSFRQTGLENEKEDGASLSMLNSFS